MTSLGFRSTPVSKSFFRVTGEAHDLEHLESHLREQIALLIEAGLSVDEAFLVAMRRIGNFHAVSQDFALENADLLWKQPVLAPAMAMEPEKPATGEQLSS